MAEILIPCYPACFALLGWLECYNILVWLGMLSLFSQEQKFLTSDIDEKFGTCILVCTYKLIEILLIVCQVHTTNMLHSCNLLISFLIIASLDSTGLEDPRNVVQ